MIKKTPQPKSGLVGLHGQEIVSKKTRLQFQPFGSQVLILPAPKREKTESGILLGDMEQSLNYGQVMSVGPGDTYDTPEVMATLEKGDTVLFGEDAGSWITINGQPFLSMRFSEIKGRLVEVDESSIVPMTKLLLHPDGAPSTRETAKVHGQATPQK